MTDRSNALPELLHGPDAEEIKARRTAETRRNRALQMVQGGGAGSAGFSLSAAFPAPLQREARKCDVHGDYLASLVQVIPSRPAMWTGCPGCHRDAAAQEQRQAIAQMQQEQRQAAAERRAAALQEMLGRAKFPRKFAAATLDNWRTCDDPRQAKALDRARWYVDTWPERLQTGSCLLMCGGVGTGKTRLAVAIARAVIDAGSTAVYAKMQEVSTALRATWNRASAATERDVLADLARPDLLVLDEVGRQLGATDYDTQALFAVVDARYSEGLPTIILSNMDVIELGEYVGDAVKDRLREGGKVIKFDWHSLRGAMDAPDSLNV